MTASNHTITGVVVASFITNPIIAVPTALISHLVLDAIPHFDWFDEKDLKSKRFNALLLFDAALAGSVLLNVFMFRPEHWVLMLICGVVAASPDLLSLPRWVNNLRGVPEPEPGPVRKFLKRIQWAEFRLGWIIEVVWFITMFWLYLSRTV